MIGGLLNLSAASRPTRRRRTTPALRSAIQESRGSFEVRQALSVSHPGVAWAPKNHLYVIMVGSSSRPEVAAAIRGTAGTIWW